MRSTRQWIASVVCIFIFALVVGILPSLWNVPFHDLSFLRSGHLHHGAASLRIVDNLYFVTEFSLGTPPQPFRGLIQHSPADLSVLSATCGSEACAHYQKYNSYNSNLSSAVTTSDSDVVLKYRSTNASGNISFDTFTIAGIEIPTQLFVEADRQAEESLYGDHKFDAIVSLSPIGNKQQPSLNTPFMSMINHGVLDVNCFSLKPPRGRTEPGELTFGRTNDLERLGNRVIRAPITDTVIRDISAPWQAEMRSVHTAGKSTTLTGHNAVIDAGYPFITLPRQAIAPLFRALKPIEYLGYTFRAIDCGRRDALPDITINLAGHNFTITAYEYTYESNFHGNVVRCLLALDDTEKEWSVLGSSFLKRFYSVFDWDNKIIGLLPLEQFNEQHADSLGYDSL